MSDAINKKQFLASIFLLVSMIMASATTARAANPDDVAGGRKTETRPKVAEMLAKEKIKLFGEKAVLRLSAALGRADDFLVRITLHIAQFPNPKFDPSLVEQKLTEAKEAIATGRLAVTAIETTLAETLNAAKTATSSSFSDVRFKINEAREAIKLAHSKIVEIITMIKSANAN